MRRMKEQQWGGSSGQMGRSVMWLPRKGDSRSEDAVKEVNAKKQDGIAVCSGKHPSPSSICTLEHPFAGPTAQGRWRAFCCKEGKKPRWDSVLSETNRQLVMDVLSRVTLHNTGQHTTDYLASQKCMFEILLLLQIISTSGTNTLIFIQGNSTDMATRTNSWDMIPRLILLGF